MLSGAKAYKSCRSRQVLSNEYLLLTIYLQTLASIQPRFRIKCFCFHLSFRTPPVPSVFEDSPVYQPASQPITSPFKFARSPRTDPPGEPEVLLRRPHALVCRGQDRGRALHPGEGPRFLIVALQTSGRTREDKWMGTNLNSGARL